MTFALELSKVFATPFQDLDTVVDPGRWPGLRLRGSFRDLGGAYMGVASADHMYKSPDSGRMPALQPGKMPPAQASASSYFSNLSERGN